MKFACSLRSLLALLSVSVFVGSALASTNGTDTASNYSTWTSGSNGNSATFNAWQFSYGSAGNNGFFLSTSTNGGGANIDTGGQSFGMYANSSNSSGAYANRSFTSALSVGQTFSFNVTDNYTDGGHGVNLYDSNNATLLTYTHAGNGYQIGGQTLSTTYASGTAVNLSFTQTSTSGGTWTVTGSGGQSFSGSGTYTGDIDAFQLFTYQNYSGSQGNFFSNSFAITGVPEPATWLAGFLTLGSAGYVFRRRTRRVA